MPSHLRSPYTRRQFLNRAGLVTLASSLPAARLLESSGESVHAAENTVPGQFIPRNRAPLSPSALYFLPLGAIRPAGWLKNQLEIQANGLSGHLDETWADVGPNSGWLGGTGESWERGPYFLDGLTPLAWLLNDDRLKAKVHRFMDWTLTHQAENGMIGPSSNDDWWPRIVMLKALTQYQELTGDPRVVPLMDKYFRYQLAELPNRPLRDWGKFRWQDEVLSVVWLYNRTGSRYLISLASLLHSQGHDWIAEYADFQYTQRITADFIKLDQGNGLKDLALSTHGVNNAQAIKTGAVWSLISGAQADRSSVLKMLTELNKYHGLPNGMFSCDEHLAGRNPSQGSELCSVVESMFSLEQALAISGDASLGDCLEKLAFNCLPGTFTDDMWAHQYNQEPNQVECSLHHKPWTTDGPESNLYGLEPNFGCCTANFHQGWPKFTNSLFLLSGDRDSDAHDGLAAAVYAPCEVRVVLRETVVRIMEETGYPFQGTVRFTLNPAVPIAFPLQLRIPGWAQGASVRINGQNQPVPTPGTFALIERTWHAGDRVELHFPMNLRVSRWFEDSVAVERGPLVFSYGIGESWVKLRSRGMTADWQVFPTTQWNYALNVDENAPERSISVAESEPVERVFTRRNAPIRLSVKARIINAWRAEDGAADPVPQSPASTDQPEETIQLIPYAAAKLRVTAFPQVKV
ncbi:MAG TPA: beta-L-arabinofuranosidase domain-containing protein [Terracidiphilus sp.]|nr:beta-L-arabinofuranosidase domain-containing protein [Terracidiphilus sp.]